MARQHRSRVGSCLTCPAAHRSPQDQAAPSRVVARPQDPGRLAAGSGWGRGSLAGPRVASKFRNLITEWPRKGRERRVLAQARLGLGTAGCARVEVCLGIWGSGWEGRQAGAPACVRRSTCPGRRGRARAQLAGSEPPPVCALALCVPGRVAGSGFESLCPPPPPSPSVPLYPLPGLSLCPRLSWGRGMLLPAGVTVNPVGRRPGSSHSLQSRPSPTPPTPQPSAPYATVLGCILQQLKGTEVTPGNPQMHQKLGLGPVASSWRNSFLACPASHPLWPPRAQEGGGPPCGRGGGEFLGRKGNGRKSWAPPGRAGRRPQGPRGRRQ